MIEETETVNEEARGQTRTAIGRDDGKNGAEAYGDEKIHRQKEHGS